MEEKTHRIKYIDYLKCFAIFSVVLGHTLKNMSHYSVISYSVENVIYSFHMPLFALLSGMFFKASMDFKSFVKKKFNQLLIPYFAEVVIVFFVIRPMLSWINNSNVDVFSFRYFFNSFAYWGAWFLRALFICFLVAYISVRMSRGYKLGAFVSIILIHGVFWLGIIPNKQQALNGFFFLYPFFWMGWFLRFYEESVIKYSKQLLLVIPISYIFLLSFWNSGVDSFYYMNTNIFHKGVEEITGFKIIWETMYRFFVGALGSLSFVLLFRFSCEADIIRIHNGFDGKMSMVNFSPILKLCTNIGKCTLGIYILQSIVFDNWDLIKMCPLPFWACFLFSILLIILCYIIVKIGSRWYLGKMVLRGNN